MTAPRTAKAAAWPRGSPVRPSRSVSNTVLIRHADARSPQGNPDARRIATRAAESSGHGARGLEPRASAPTGSVATAERTPIVNGHGSRSARGELFTEATSNHGRVTEAFNGAPLRGVRPVAIPQGVLRRFVETVGHLGEDPPAEPARDGEFSRQLLDVPGDHAGNGSTFNIASTAEAKRRDSVRRRPAARAPRRVTS